MVYIRFASVYRKFEDIEAFADVIQEIGDAGSLDEADASVQEPEVPMTPESSSARAAVTRAGNAMPAARSAPAGQGPRPLPSTGPIPPAGKGRR